MITPQDIISGIKQYSNEVDGELIKEAYIFSLKHHGTQIRESGDPFFTHPLEVAEILISLKMDQKTIIAGILHDTVEDTEATISVIESKFGKDVAKIVDGVTKLSKFEGSSLAQKQTENFKKLLLSAASDIRVLIIKLVDRLHNMRTLKYKKKKAKRNYIARETMEIYAPLAERIGMSTIKDELQDISFKELYPEIYNSISGKLKNLQESADKNIKDISAELMELARGFGIDCVVNGRLKTPYSVWQKMNIRSISFEQLSDIMAFRIIVDSVNQCYQILGGIHRTYIVVPGRFRDYISTPKNNSYQSLHTSVIGPLNKRIEVQIRTKEMHEISEFGIAAHWNYKEGGNESKQKNSVWLQNLVHILENTSGMDEFLANSKVEMFNDCVYCITPKGNIVSLPQGSSALDFAYAIHSDVGNQAKEAKINGKTVHIKTIIENGDQIEIFTDKQKSPSPHWESYVVTLKAKTEIKKALNCMEKERIEMIGKLNFQEFFEANELDICSKDVENIYHSLGFETIVSFYYAVGKSEVNFREILSKYNKLRNQKKELAMDDLHQEELEGNQDKAVFPVVGLPKLPILPVTCCSPVPGDKIVGLMFLEKGVEIHLSKCKVLMEQKTNSDAKVIDLVWEAYAFKEEMRYLAKLSIKMFGYAGNLSKIANVIEKKNADIVNLKIGDKFDNFVQTVIEIEVNDSYQINIILAELRCLDFIKEAVRI